MCSQIWSGSLATESISGGIDNAKNNASTNSSHTADDTSLQIAKKKQLDDGSDEDREQEDEAKGKDHKNKHEGVTVNTAKAISS